MNFRLTPKKEKAEKHVGVLCFYCKRVLQNRQALGGHLKVHKEEINAKRSQRYDSHFSNSEITTHNAHPFSMLHPEIFSGVAGSNPSNLIGCTAVPTGIPSGLSFSFVINGVCELNNDQFQSFTNGMPYLRAHIDGIISYHVKAVTDLDSDLRSNQSACFKERSTGGSLPPHPSQSSGQGEIGRCKTETVLTSKKRKRCSLHEARGSAEMMNALKRPKINSELSMETDKPPHLSQSSGQGEIGLYKTQTALNSIGGKRHCFGEGGGNAEIMNAPSMERDKPPHLSQSSGQGEIGLYKTQTALNSIGGKRHCFGEGGGNAEIMNAPSMERDKPPKRELLLFKDSENCFSGSGIASNLCAHRAFGATITCDPAGVIGSVSDTHLWGTLEMFTLAFAYGLFFEGGKRPGSCWSFCGKIACDNLEGSSLLIFTWYLWEVGWKPVPLFSKTNWKYRSFLLRSLLKWNGRI
ncbi:hypothetical protein ACFX2A_004799 [Malus domestica]